MDVTDLLDNNATANRPIASHAVMSSYTDYVLSQERGCLPFVLQISFVL